MNQTCPDFKPKNNVSNKENCPNYWRFYIVSSPIDATNAYIPYQPILWQCYYKLFTVFFSDGLETSMWKTNAKIWKHFVCI